MTCTQLTVVVTFLFKSLTWTLLRFVVFWPKVWSRAGSNVSLLQHWQRRAFFERFRSTLDDGLKRTWGVLGMTLPEGPVMDGWETSYLHHCAWSTLMKWRICSRFSDIQRFSSFTPVLAWASSTIYCRIPPPLSKYFPPIQSPFLACIHSNPVYAGPYIWHVLICFLCSPLPNTYMATFFSKKPAHYTHHSNPRVCNRLRNCSIHIYNIQRRTGQY